MTRLTCRFTLLRVVEPVGDGALTEAAEACEARGGRVDRHRHRTLLVAFLLPLQTGGERAADGVAQPVTLRRHEVTRSSRGHKVTAGSQK